MYYSKPSPNAGDTFFESSAFGQSALDELNIVWESYEYVNAAVENLRK
jgi:hypothetical protein